MTTKSLICQTSNPQETADIAVRLGRGLHAGDVVLLGGSIGTGKTHFARHLIQSLQANPEDVPSPSFTLIQVYETDSGEIWHADLYRLSSPSEVEELGLPEAFETAICLVEWPDRLGPLAPPQALIIEFALGTGETERTLSFNWTADRWSQLVQAPE